MPLSIKYDIFTNNKFDYPFRIFISGSSQSGKTCFAGKLLNHGEIFKKKVKSVRYYHPDYLSHSPVDWHNELDISVTYQSGLPNLAELCDIEPDTCLVIDDLYEESVNSQAIDYLFRVLSGKKSLSVMILSQRYFSQGKFGMNIRNNCNFTVLLRNVDAKLNARVASLMNLKQSISAAIKDTYDNNYYPYIFIDSSPRGQVSGYRVYTNIFDRYQIGYTNRGMKAYIIGEKDFLRYFSIINKNSAEYNHGCNTHDVVKDAEKEKSKITTERPDKSYHTQRGYSKSTLGQRAKIIRNRRKARKNI